MSASPTANSAGPLADGARPRGRGRRRGGGPRGRPASRWATTSSCPWSPRADAARHAVRAGGRCVSRWAPVRSPAPCWTAPRGCTARAARALQHGLTVACFAQYAVVAAAAAIPIASDVPLWQAALLGCGVVTGFGAVAHAARVRVGERVCVVGCGGVGLQVIAAARLAGAAQIVAVDRRPEKLEHALARGATARGRRQRRRPGGRGAGSDRRWRRSLVRGRRRAGDDPDCLGRSAPRRNRRRRRPGARRRRGVAAGNRVPVGEVDHRQLLRLRRSRRDAARSGRSWSAAAGWSWPTSSRT